MGDAGHSVHLLAAQLDTIQRKYAYQVHETQRLELQAQSAHAQLAQQTVLQDALATTVVVLLQHLRRPSLVPAVRALLEQYVGAAASIVLRVDSASHCFLTATSSIPLRGLAWRAISEQSALCLSLDELSQDNDYCAEVDIPLLPEYTAELALLVLPIYPRTTEVLPTAVLEVLLSRHDYITHAWKGSYLDTLAILLGPCIEVSASASTTNAEHAKDITHLHDGIGRLLQATSAVELTEALTQWLESVDALGKKQRWIQVGLYKLERDMDTIVALASSSSSNDLPIEMEVMSATLTALKLRPVLNTTRKYLLLPLRLAEETYGVAVHGAVVAEDLARLERLVPSLLQCLQTIQILELTSTLETGLLQLLLRSSTDALAHALRSFLGGMTRDNGVCFLLRLPHDPPITSTDHHARKAYEQLAHAIAAKTVVVDQDDDVQYITKAFAVSLETKGAFGVAIQRSAPRGAWKLLVQACCTALALTFQCDAIQCTYTTAQREHAEVTMTRTRDATQVAFLSSLLQLDSAARPEITAAVDAFFRAHFNVPRATLFWPCENGLQTWVAHQQIHVTSGVPLVCAMSHALTHGSPAHPAYDATFDRRAGVEPMAVVCFPLTPIAGCLEVAIDHAVADMELCVELLVAWLPRAMARIDASTELASERTRLQARWDRHVEMLAQTHGTWDALEANVTSAPDLMQRVHAIVPATTLATTADLFVLAEDGQLWTMRRGDRVVAVLDEEPFFTQALEMKKASTGTSTLGAWLSPVLSRLYQSAATTLYVVPVASNGTVQGLVAFGRLEVLDDATTHLLQSLSLYISSLLTRCLEQDAWTARVENAQALAVWAHEQLRELTTHQVETEVRLLEQRLVAALATCAVDKISATALAKRIEDAVLAECTPWLYSHAYYLALDGTQSVLTNPRLSMDVAIATGMVGHACQTGSVVTTGSYPASVGVTTAFPIEKAQFASDIRLESMCASPAFDAHGRLLGVLVFIAVSAAKGQRHRQPFECRVLPSLQRALAQLYQRWQQTNGLYHRLEQLQDANTKVKDTAAIAASSVTTYAKQLDCVTQCLALVHTVLSASAEAAPSLVEKATQSLLDLGYVQWHDASALAAGAVCRSQAEAKHVAAVYAQTQSRIETPASRIKEDINVLCVPIYNPHEPRRLLGILYGTQDSSSSSSSTHATDRRWVLLACTIALSVNDTRGAHASNAATQDRALAEYAATATSLQTQLRSTQGAMAFLQNGYECMHALSRTETIFSAVRQLLPRLLQTTGAVVLYVADHTRRVLWSLEPKVEVAFGDGPVGSCLFTHEPSTLDRHPGNLQNLHDMYLPLWHQDKTPRTLLGVLEVQCRDAMPAADYLALRQRVLVLLEELHLASHIDHALARIATKEALVQQTKTADQFHASQAVDSAKKRQLELATAATMAANRVIAHIQQWPTKRDFWGHALESIEENLGQLPSAHEAHVYVAIPKEDRLQRRRTVLVPSHDSKAMAMVQLLLDEDRAADGLAFKLVKQRPSSSAISTDLEAAIATVFPAWSVTLSESTHLWCCLRVKLTEDCIVLLVVIIEHPTEAYQYWPWLRLLGSLACQLVAHTLAIESLGEKYSQQKMHFLSDANGVGMDLLRLTRATESATSRAAFAQMVAGHVKVMLHAARVELQWRTTTTEDAEEAAGIAAHATFVRRSERSVSIVLRSPDDVLVGLLDIDAFDTSLAKTTGLWDQLAFVMGLAYKQWTLQHALQDAEHATLAKNDAYQALEAAHAELTSALRSHSLDREHETRVVTHGLQELLKLLQASPSDWSTDKLCKAIGALPTIQMVRLFRADANHLELLAVVGASRGPVTTYLGHLGVAGLALQSETPVVLAAHELAASPYHADVDGFLDVDAPHQMLLSVAAKPASMDVLPMILVVHATTGPATSATAPIWTLLTSLLQAVLRLGVAQQATDARVAVHTEKLADVANERDALLHQVHELQDHVRDRVQLLDFQQILLSLQPDALASTSLPELSMRTTQALTTMVPQSLLQLYWCTREQFFWVDPLDQSIKQMPASAFVDHDTQRAILSGATVQTYKSATLEHKLLVSLQSPTTNYVLGLLQASRYEVAFSTFEVDLLAQFAKFLCSHVQRLVESDMAKDAASRRQTSRLSTLAQLSTAVTASLPKHPLWVHDSVHASFFAPDAAEKPALVAWFESQVRLQALDTTVLSIPSVHDDDRCRRDTAFWKKHATESLLLFDVRVQNEVGSVLVQSPTLSFFDDVADAVARDELAPALTKVFAAVLSTTALTTTSTAQEALYSEVHTQVDDLVAKCAAISDESRAMQACLGYLAELYAADDEASVRSTAQDHLQLLFPLYEVVISSEKNRLNARWCMPLGHTLCVWLSNGSDPSSPVPGPWTHANETIWLQYTSALRTVLQRVLTAKAEKEAQLKTLHSLQKRERDGMRALQAELDASQDTIQQLQATIDDLGARDAQHRELKAAQKQSHRREKELEQQLVQQAMEIRALRKEAKRRIGSNVAAMSHARIRGLGQELKELATLEATQVEKLQAKTRRSFETQT
ncbi:hypothetical protein SPRG_02577 [Saprolegnia parasitica CBS 223.65]|uniref:GAF domain-containing protein n=1 Tax=Saprolegnia parasitica (strain CBS 223.65) TaxID=695850 RepID=A0A067CUF1_SAPPC|nr:hypothetical protein SPRG_02577 [Saprolegnia parasitica CBS 223.65]KDO32885.1 hypothetical protein SPRG_02577 [Saprolegnia parasitica CBS 223.65]|eukprot:XP_012196536.1 hypothetical protein SPRG_02577 [Saprolegnia parasitica CBS 223.65]